MMRSDPLPKDVFNISIIMLICLNKNTSGVFTKIAKIGFEFFVQFACIQHTSETDFLDTLATLVGQKPT